MLLTSPEPSIPDEVSQSALRHGEPTKELISFYSKEARRFEVSRIIKFSFPLSSIESIYFCSWKETGLLALDLIAPPQFLTRRVNSGSPSRNEWRARADFSPAKQISKFSRQYFVADLKHLSVVIGLMFSLEPDLQKKLVSTLKLNKGNSFSSDKVINNNNTTPQTPLKKVFTILQFT
jgi:hypothetical protein